MKYIERFIETEIDMILMNQITEINELFKETELYLTEEENGVRLYFHTVDMKKLEEYVNNALPKEFPLMEHSLWALNVKPIRKMR
jgi:hypothetical protein